MKNKAGPDVTCVSYKADLVSLPYMLEFVRERVHQSGFDRKTAQRIEIALEEAIVNVIHHAYPQGKVGRIELTALHRPKQCLQFIIKDQGVPFNPLERPCEVNLDLTLEEREEGGLGLKFMKAFMDDIRYERQKDFNVLTLEKRIHRAAVLI